MATNIEISRVHYETLVQQALSTYPFEACGLLAGKKVWVQHLYPVDNIRRSSVAYEMDPSQQLRAMIDMEQRGWDLIAIYHSHPHGPPMPSATDVAQAYYPDAAHVIISLIDQKDPTVRCFRITSGRVREISLQIV